MIAFACPLQNAPIIFPDCGTESYRDIAIFASSGLIQTRRMGFPNRQLRDSWAAGLGRPAMLTTMTEQDWTIVLQVFGASRSRRGDKGRDDRRFLEALHYFAVHNITWRALPAQFGHWNSVWKRF